MKLYFYPGSCSLAAHIALHETGQPFETAQVDIFTKKCADGSDYLAVNPKGAVPALGLDDGSVLTECAAVLQYIADRHPEAGIVPAAGSLERYRVQEALSYIGTEVHKSFSVQFSPGAPDAWKATTRAVLERHFDRLAGHLGSHEWIAGSRYSIADVYLFVVLGWAVHVKLDLARWPALAAYHARIAQRPAVQKAMRAEGIIG